MNPPKRHKLPWVLGTGDLAVAALAVATACGCAPAWSLDSAHDPNVDGSAPSLDAGSHGDTSAGSGADSGGDAAAPTTTILDSPTGEAFDPVRGVSNVDYAGYLSKHDIVYNKPNTNPLYGLTVGSGRVGAMVWSAHGLTMQVGGVDASQQAVFSAGLASLSTSPPLDAAATFQQRLRLYDGALETVYDKDRRITIFGAAASEAMGIHVEDARSGVTAITFDLGLWDVSALGNAGNVPNLQTWKTVTTFADPDVAGLSRGQTDANQFGYTLAATVEGAAFKTSVANGHVLLSITPSASYTIWLACASRLNAPSHDSVAQAKQLLAQLRSAGYSLTWQKAVDFWHSQWGKSFVQYSDSAGEGDYLENVYYLTTYIILSGGFGNYPFHFINGVFRATGDDTKWSNAYWYWNQRDVYASFLASNHADVLGVFNTMYSRNAAALKAFTQTRYGVDGIWVPETMGWNGNADGTVGSDYTKNILSTGVEVAESMMAQYDFTGDEDYLKNTAYPFVREVTKLYSKMLTKDGAGKYHMASSNAHETYWSVPNAITDLAAVRSLFPVAIGTSAALGVDQDLRPQWQEILDNLVPYPTDGTHYLPHQPPIAQTRNDENVACEIIWPYGVTGIGAADYDMAVSTWKARPFPYGNVWANDAIQAARLGLGDDAKQGMKTMLQKYQNYPNGFTNNTNGVFEYLGVNLSAMNESLLQSYDGKIRVFPALPSDSGFVARFTLAAKGGFLVSAEREGGAIKYVGIKSLLGHAAKVVNPWGTEEATVRRLSDGAVLLGATSGELTFPTTANGIYVIERKAKPFSEFAYAYVTGSPNQDPKTLPGSSTGLGIASP